jgi:hypothetical protein
LPKQLCLAGTYPLLWGKNKDLFVVANVSVHLAFMLPDVGGCGLSSCWRSDMFTAAAMHWFALGFCQARMPPQTDHAKPSKGLRLMFSSSKFLLLHQSYCVITTV